MAESPKKTESAQTPPPPNGGPPPPLSRNSISFFGWIVTIVVGVITVLLIGAEALLKHENPYSSVITYMVLPGFLGGGVMLILLGVFLEWRRRHRREPGEYPRLPTIDMNKPWQRRRVMIAAVSLSVFFVVSAVGTYHAYHFTESQTFCGEVCHIVMEPEYTAYKYSPHARVLCTECHIGSGADWYVKSKMSGLRQVIAMVTKSYELPIETPVHNLRPARDTCEECHWPGKFSGSFEREIWHYEPDQSNTVSRTNMLMHVGGGDPEVGLGSGIHWHISEQVKVRYWASDPKRMEIPWVEVQVGDGEPRVFRSADSPESPPPDADIRTMDCIDCHNRPSHIYRSPRVLVDFMLSKELLDPSLPYVKRNALKLLETRYEDTESAMKAIEDGMRAEYASRMDGEQGRALVERNIEWVKEAYRRNIFPEQGVDWREFPNHIGHFEFPGCYRCHDGEHVDEGGEAISADCNLCHEIIGQAQGEAVFEKPEYKRQDYRHPRGMDDIWRGQKCTDCHGFENTDIPVEQKVAQAE